MSTFAKVGSFVPRAGPGNQAITGIGFQPKFLLIWGELTPIVASSFTVFRYSFVGFTDGVTQIGASAAENRFVSPSDVNTALDVFVIFGKSYLNSGEMVAGLVSFDADGFTLNWSINSFGAACSFFYLAIGGTSVSAKVAQFNSTGLGNQAVTGVGFKPTMLLGMCGMTGGVNQATQQFGWSDGLIDGSVLANAKNAANPGHTLSLQRNSIYTDVDFSTDTIKNIGTISTLDADGFTVNWSVHNSLTSCYYAALNGLAVSAGRTTQPLATGAQVINSPFNGILAALLMSVNQVASVNLYNDLREFRAGISSGSQASAWTGSLNGNATSESGRTHRTNILVEHAHIPGPGSIATLDAEASGVLSGSALNLTWTTADAVAREFLYLLISPPVSKIFVSAGPDQDILLSASATLNGSYFIV